MALISLRQQGALATTPADYLLLVIKTFFLMSSCRRADKQDFILSTEQVNPVPAPMALDLVMKKEKPEPRGTRRKHSIVLEERTKLLKAAAHEQRQTKEVAPKQESTLDNTCCMTAKEPSKIAKKTCKCLGEVDCEHMNFQVCCLVYRNSHSVTTVDKIPDYRVGPVLK